MNTTEIIKTIIKDIPQIEYLYIVEYGDQKDVMNDSPNWSLSDNMIYEKALDLRNSIGLPFWQSLMLVSIHTPQWSKVCLDACIRHNKLKYEKISAFDFLNTDYNEEKIGISSKIIFRDKKVMHLPFLDFLIPISEKNTEIVEYICTLLDKFHKGYIINSGKSYHYIGSHLISDDQIIHFLSKANLFSPITDSTWISHQLFERACTLRLGPKNGIFPTLIKKID